MSNYLTRRNDKWAYVNGVVAFGDSYHEAARDAAGQSGLDETQTTYVSNMVARQQMPDGHAVAIGQLANGRPQIWLSGVDRNLVMAAVVSALDAR